MVLIMKKQSFAVTVLAALTLTGVLAGCNNTTTIHSNSTSANATPATDKQLVFYSAQGYDAAMAKAFQAATGIPVKLVDDSTGNIVAKMEAERSNPHWDIAWFDGDSTMQTLDNQGMLLQNWTPSDVSNYTALGQSLVPGDKAYYPAGVTAAAALGYNTTLVSATDAPKDWNDLLKPEFKNAIAMNDPSISGPTYPFVAGMMQLLGQSKGRQYFQNLKANGLKVFPTNDNSLKALVAGQVKVIMIQDSALISAKNSGDKIQIVYPSSGVFTLPGVMSIDKNAPDMDAAKKFVEWVLSPAGQKVALDVKNGGGDSYYNPVIQGVQPNAERQQSGVNWVRVNPVKAAQDEDSLKLWFHENIFQ